MNKFLALIAVLALAISINAQCPPNVLGLYFFNNNLAVGPISGIFDVASFVIQGFSNTGVSIFCTWFGWFCPTCQNLNPMTNLTSNWV